MPPLGDDVLVPFALTLYARVHGRLMSSILNTHKQIERLS
jgi:hypothetical protein